jgi:hypothetical protein
MKSTERWHMRIVDLATLVVPRGGTLGKSVAISQTARSRCSSIVDSITSVTAPRVTRPPIAAQPAGPRIVKRCYQEQLRTNRCIVDLRRSTSNIPCFRSIVESFLWRPEVHVFSLPDERLRGERVHSVVESRWNMCRNSTNRQRVRGSRSQAWRTPWAAQ